MTTYTVAAVGWTAFFIAGLWLLVQGIDRLDRWARRFDADIQIILEDAPSNVVVLDERRAS